MHLQIRTSPGDPADNLHRVLKAMASAHPPINIEGIGPELETTHLRTVVSHARLRAAMQALEAEGFVPTKRPAVTALLENREGALLVFLEHLREEGYTVESVLVLASREDGSVLVSIGVAGVPPNWSAVAAELGGWEEPDGWEGA